MATANASAALIVLEAAPGRDGVALFPGEDGEGISFSQAETMRQSRVYSRLYARLVAAAAPALAREAAVPEAAAALLARRALVPFAHFYFDRALRLSLAASEKTEVPSGPAFPPPDGIERFQSLALDSPAFNEALLRRLARVFGFSVRELPPLTEAAPAAGGANRNFDPPSSGPGALLRKAWAKLVAAPLSRRFGRLPTLSMAYARLPLRANSFYLRLLRELPHDWELSAPQAVSARREAALVRPLRAAAADVAALAQELGLETGRARRLADDFADYAAETWPASYLEGFAANLDRAGAALACAPGRALLFSEAGDARDPFYLAAARANGVSTIGVQHAGHYGYLADNAEVEELEFAFCDGYISWGWTGVPDNAACASLRVTPLPTPWLSDRASVPLPVTDHAAKPFDLLLMSNKVKRFSQAPTGAIFSRRDLIRPFADQLRALVTAAARRGVRVLHKSYNPGSESLLSRTHADLVRLGGDCYELWAGRDKGLTPELLASARLVVWDQPGTGFLECLARGIPTLVLWPRLYNEETAEARADFAALEAAGVVHRDVDGLLDATLSFRENPGSWINDDRRRAAIDIFSRDYVRTSPDWAANWKSFLSTL